MLRLLKVQSRLMHRLLLPLLFLLLSQLQLQSSVAEGAAAKTIYDDLLTNLFSDYKQNAMPICKQGDRLEVGQDVLLYQLFDLDEPTQMLSVDVWIESTWRDCRLLWNPANFNNVTEFAIKSEELWYPDLIFYESLHGNFEEGMFIYGESTARVRFDGWIKLGAQALLKSFCRIDISKFPYDSQRCNITFSSWTKDIRSFLLTRKSGDANDHAFESASNGEWEVTGFPAFTQQTPRRIGVDEGGEPAVYSEVVFQLRLRRKYLFHQAYMLFPCMLLAWLAAFAFFLPTECGERIAYATTILLSLVVFLLLIADNIPRSGDAVPVLGVYFCLTVCLVGLCTLMVIVAYNVSLKSNDFCPPAWLTACCYRLGPLVGFRPTHHGGRVKLLSFRMNPRNPTRSTCESAENDDKNDENAAAISTEDTATPTTPTKATGGAACRHPPLEGGTGFANTWRYMGIVLDRLFFAVYCLLNLGATVWILACRGG